MKRLDSVAHFFSAIALEHGQAKRLYSLMDVVGFHVAQNHLARLLYYYCFRQRRAYYPNTRPTISMLCSELLVNPDVCACPAHSS